MDKPNTLEVLNVFSENDAHSELWWRTDSEYAPITFFVNCNDLFCWGCADCEEIENDNDLEALKLAFEDCKNTHRLGQYYASLLWVCRKRKARPQGAYYSHFMKELWPLFDACSPERETGFGNPYKPGEYKRGRRLNWLNNLLSRLKASQ